MSKSTTQIFDRLSTNLRIDVLFLNLLNYCVHLLSMADILIEFLFYYLIYKLYVNNIWYEGRIREGECGGGGGGSDETQTFIFVVILEFNTK